MVHVNLEIGVSILTLQIKMQHYIVNRIFFKRVEGVVGINEGSHEYSQAGSSAPCSTSSIPTASSTSVSISRGSRTIVRNSFRSRSAKSGMRLKPLHTSSKATKRKRVRRGGKKNKLQRCIKARTKPCVFFNENIDGFTSKRDSLKQLIIEHSIDILILTETEVYTKTKIRLEGFQVFPVCARG